MSDTQGPWPQDIESVEQLEELLSRPTAEVVDVVGRLKGRLMILGAGGKIGPSLTAMACRARDQAGADLEIVAASRFSDSTAQWQLERAGAVTVSVYLLAVDAVAALPAAENVIYMAGMKFGATGNPALMWAMNTLAPANAARRYRDSRILAYSTGCVYGFTSADSGGSVESDKLDGMGEYCQACIARERVLEHCGRQGRTPMLFLRLNYAVEMRYGVFVDIAQDVLAGRPINLATGHFNAIWQGDSNVAALRLLERAALPPEPINVTGPEILSVREVAGRMGKLMGKRVTFTGREMATSLLSNPAKALGLIGPPPTPLERVIEWTVRWVCDGRANLNKPTHFQVRDGKF